MISETFNEDCIGVARFPDKWFEYGGMKRGQKTKSHICDDYGKVLCGVKSNWMEAGQEITTEAFVKGSEHLFPMTDKRHATCKKCIKKWMGVKEAQAKRFKDYKAQLTFQFSE